MNAVPELTRRRYPERPDCWHVYYGDIHVGTIALRVGIPHDENPWGWSCGFYPGSHPGEHTNGSAPTFEDARADFEQAWRAFLSRRTETDFREWREAHAFTAWKYAMFEKGYRMPTQSTDGRSRCFCGETIDIAGVDRHVFTAYAPEPNPQTKKKDVVWFALNEDRPLFAFGGLWTEFKGDRGTKSKPIPGPLLLDDHTERDSRADPSQSHAGDPNNARGMRRLDARAMGPGKSVATAPARRRVEDRSARGG